MKWELLVFLISQVTGQLFPEEITNVRLVGGSRDSEGRVEVFVNGEWGTVCDDGWDLQDAEVVCRQLGYSGALEAPRSAYFGEGVDPILLEDVECLGTETSLNDCPKNDIGDHNCDHDEDAGVICYDSGTGNPTCDVVSEFVCHDGSCIPLSWVCDSYDDCHSGIDEFYCGTGNPTCDAVSEFICNDGSCIPLGWVCDLYEDCPSGVDEYNCGFQDSGTSQINPGASGNFSCVFRISEVYHSHVTIYLSRENDTVITENINNTGRNFSLGQITFTYDADNIYDGDILYCLAVSNDDGVVLTFLGITVNEYVLPVLTSGPNLLKASVSTITIRWREWDAELDVGDPPVVAYIPYYRKVSSDEWTRGPEVNTSLTYNAVNLERDTLYGFSVAAVREGENGEGSRSPETNFRTTRCDVLGFRDFDVNAKLDVASNSVNVSWQIAEEAKCDNGELYFSIHLIEINGSSNGDDPYFITSTKGDIHWIILNDLSNGMFRFLVTVTIDGEVVSGALSETILIENADLEEHPPSTGTGLAITEILSGISSFVVVCFFVAGTICYCVCGKGARNPNRAV